MNQKKILTMALIAVAAVWLSCLTSVVCVTMIRDSRAAQTTAPSVSVTETTTAATTTTTAPHSTTERLPVDGNIVVTTVQVEDPEWLVQQQASIYASQLAEQISNSLTTTAPTTSDNSNVPTGKAEIINAYINGVNTLKKTGNFTMHKNDTLDMSFDSITGGAIVQSFADSILQQNQKVPLTYSFVNGTDAATGATPLSAIAPLNTYAAVNEAAVITANSAPDSTGGFTIELVIQDEQQTHELAAPNLSTLVEVIDVTPLLPAGASLKELQITYTGTKITASFDKNGNITSIMHYLNVDYAKASGGYGMLNVTMEMHGNFTSKYTFTY